MNGLRTSAGLAASVMLFMLAHEGCVASSEHQSRGLVEGAWSRFRGPNGSGVATASGLPAEFGLGRNEIWRTPLPPGHSSPVLSAEYVFLTAVDEDTLYTYAVDRRTGRVRWRAPAPRPRREALDRLNDPASPTPVTDGDGVYVFFGDFGLIAYEIDGSERWQLPLGPFDNAYGMGASPVLVGDLVIQVCDQKTDSFMVAVDKRDGSVRWRVERPGSSTGHSTPILYETRANGAQLLVPGSFQLTAYAGGTGERLWWVRGLAFEMKATPVLDPSSETVFINGTSASAFEDSYDRAIPAFDEIIGSDADGDGLLNRDEIPDQLARRWIKLIDLDGNGLLDRGEWEWYRAARASQGGVNAFRTGGSGDMTASSFLWNHDRSVPQLPSALLYEGVLYMVNDGGVVTLLDAATGAVLDRGRLQGAIDSYYASPVAADDKVYMVSETCKIAVLESGTILKVLAVNDLDEVCFATPAIEGDRIYVRTRSNLHAFGVQKGAD